MAKPKLILNPPKAAKPTPEAQGKMAGRGWSGTLTFGRISLPVLLYTAAREERVSFNQLHAHSVVDGKATGEYCGSRLKQKLVCPVCDVDVEKDEIVKGYAIDEKSGQYVLVTPEELEAQKAYNSDVMAITDFVPIDQIPPLYFESSFYLAPDQKLPLKTYATLRAAMVADGKAAVVTITKSQKEQIAFLVPANDDAGMYCFLSFMADEIRVMQFPKLPAVNDKELALARKLIDQMSDDFHPENYQDSYRANVMQLIEAKKDGKEVPVLVQKKAPGMAIDLEAALEASLVDVRDKRKQKKAS